MGETVESRQAVSSPRSPDAAQGGPGELALLITPVGSLTVGGVAVTFNQLVRRNGAEVGAVRRIGGVGNNGASCNAGGGSRMETGWLDFERPIIELEQKIEDLRAFADKENLEFSDELQNLERRAEKVRSEVYANLSSWQRVLIARHPRRPYTLDYVGRLFTDFIELHGDRRFRDDRAIVCGLARFEDRPVVIVGHQKGRNTKENLLRNFAMPHPEGYRKAIRVMRMAEKFGHPIISFIDTPGAYPGIGAEERGQAEAIASNLVDMAGIRVPILVIVIGEGGSGGALALAIGDEVLMMENAIYSVISPEGCAAILWKDQTKAQQAAEALRLTAPHLEKLGTISKIVPEPLGGAHRDLDGMAETLRTEIRGSLERLTGLSAEDLLAKRREMFLRMGIFAEE